jgi:translation elongation factor EF-4
LEGNSVTLKKIQRLVICEEEILLGEMLLQRCFLILVPSGSNVFSSTTHPLTFISYALCRQMFEITIQAAIGSKVIARET